MQVKIKKLVNEKLVKLESPAEIKEVIINEDIMQPKEESISICYRGENSSGIIELKTSELEHINSSLKNKTRLVKGVKKFKFEKD